MSLIPSGPKLIPGPAGRPHIGRYLTPERARTARRRERSWAPRVAHPGCARIAASRSAPKEEADGALTGRVRRRAARGSSGNAPLAPPPVVPDDLPGGAFPGPAPGRHPAAGVLLPRHAPARGVEDHLRRWLHADLRGPRAPARPDSARRRGGRRGHGGRQDDRPRVSLHQARRGPRDRAGPAVLDGVPADDDHREERAVPAAAVVHTRGALRGEHRDRVDQPAAHATDGGRDGEALRRGPRRARLLRGPRRGRRRSRRARGPHPLEAGRHRRGAGARPPRPAPGDHRAADLRRRNAGGLRRPLRPIAGPRSPCAYGANDSKYFIVTIWLFGESCLTSLTQRSRFAGSPNVSRRSRGGALNGASKLSQWVGRTIFG